MARYSLIIRDSVYATLTQMALERGMTVGKLINVILEQYVSKRDVKDVQRCLLCGDKDVTMVARSPAAGSVYFCMRHSDIAKMFQSYSAVKRREVADEVGARR